MQNQLKLKYILERLTLPEKIKEKHKKDEGESTESIIYCQPQNPCMMRDRYEFFSTASIGFGTSDLL
ncbi:MAG: hypothetical protein OXI53_06280 [Nitrospira sp.]|nr:hypothetical protein [Nitrospira sp.]MDE0487460.1 hypothetical protein [Nitrospira sp.]